MWAFSIDVIFIVVCSLAESNSSLLFMDSTNLCVIDCSFSSAHALVAHFFHMSYSLWCIYFQLCYLFCCFYFIQCHSVCHGILDCCYFLLTCFFSLLMTSEAATTSYSTCFSFLLVIFIVDSTSFSAFAFDFWIESQCCSSSLVDSCWTLVKTFSTAWHNVAIVSIDTWRGCFLPVTSCLVQLIFYNNNKHFAVA